MTKYEHIAQLQGIELTPEQQGQLRDHERGVLLNDITQHPAWETVLDVMEEHVKDIEDRFNKLVNSAEVDPNKLLAGKAEVRATRLFFQQFQAAVEYLKQEAQNPPEISRLLQSLL
jgi:tRNA-dihydrouridine synthase